MSPLDRAVLLWGGISYLVALINVLFVSRIWVVDNSGGICCVVCFIYVLGVHDVAESYGRIEFSTSTICICQSVLQGHVAINRPVFYM